jgi:hypothetical protein
MKILALLLCALLLSCSHQPPSIQAQPETVAVLSLLGDELEVDVASRSLLSARQHPLDISPWKLNEGFRALLEDAAKARGKEAKALSVDPAALERALALREGRFRKVLGHYNQALLDLLFREAEAQGISHFFLLTPRLGNEKFPQHRGTAGVHCSDLKQKQAKAYAYFAFELAYWHVASKRRVFWETAGPPYTQDQAFAECSAVANSKEPLVDLEAPVRQAMATVVSKVVAKMGWEKPTP